jgi:hypothetical protein
LLEFSSWNLHRIIGRNIEIREVGIIGRNIEIRELSGLYGSSIFLVFEESTYCFP